MGYALSWYSNMAIGMNEMLFFDCINPRTYKIKPDRKAETMGTTAKRIDANRIFISGVNTPVCVQLLIDAPEFVIGKSDSCNGVLSFNEEISREHCKIVWHDSQYYIVDLNSTNGTYLNSEMLAPNQEYPIRPGDHLRLSASTFLVEQIYNATRR